MEWFEPRAKTKLYTNKQRSGQFPIHGKLHGPRPLKSHNNTENDNYKFSHRHNFNLYTIAKKLCLLLATTAVAAPVSASDVGGISATANPIANSSGSVTNQAIQVLQGPYIQNGYGDGIVCQGPTANFTPYVTRSTSWQFPYEDRYDDPVYNMLDLVGDTDSDGNAIPDGIPDNPGEVLYYRDIRTGQKDNYNWNAGFSATISWPLDRKAQELCKESAKNHNELREQFGCNSSHPLFLEEVCNVGGVHLQKLLTPRMLTLDTLAHINDPNTLFEE